MLDVGKGTSWPVHVCTGSRDAPVVGGALPGDAGGSAMPEDATPEQAPPAVDMRAQSTVGEVAPEEQVTRRTVLRLGAAGATGVAVTAAHGLVGPFLAERGLASADGAFAATS